MRRLLVAVLLAIPVYGQMFPFPGPGRASSAVAPSKNLLTHTAAYIASNSGSTTAISTTGASLLVVGLTAYGQNATTDCSITDAYSNTWHHLGSQGNGSAAIAIWYSWGTGSGLSVGATHTVTASCGWGGSLLSVTFDSYTGTLTATDPLDQQTGSGASEIGTPIQTGSITPTIAGTLLVSIQGNWYSDGVTCTLTTPTFAVTDCVHVAVLSGAQAWYVQPAAAAINPTWTVSSASHASAAIASFK